MSKDVSGTAVQVKKVEVSSGHSREQYRTIHVSIRTLSPSKMGVLVLLSTLVVSYEIVFGSPRFLFPEPFWGKFDAPGPYLDNLKEHYTAHTRYRICIWHFFVEGLDTLSYFPFYHFQTLLVLVMFILLELLRILSFTLGAVLCVLCEVFLK